MYKIEIIESKKKYYWRIVHKNGKILAHSEKYSTRGKAKQTAKNLFAAFKKGTCTFSC